MLKPGKVGIMHSQIVVAVFLTCLAYSQPGTSNVGTVPTSQLHSYTKSSAAKTRIKTSVDEFALWMDGTKWKQDHESENPHLLTFTQVNGEAGALIISGRLSMPTTVLRDNLLSSGREGDPNARITFEEKRIVNGRPVLAIEISTTMEGEPYKFLGYVHGGGAGSIAVIGIIPESLYTKNKQEMTEFLNGLEVSDQELTTTASREVMPEPGLLLVNSRVSIKYDPAKWKEIKSDEIGTFTFIHSSGDGYAKVKSERLAPPFDFLPNVVLSNLQSGDPNARITVKERRTVNGADVWFLKSDSEVNRIPMVLCGYYYSGKSGTIQVVTMTGKSLFGEFEKDFMDFLNGLSISE